MVTQPVVTGPASNLSNAGTAASPQIIYVNGDLTLSGNVTGTVTTAQNHPQIVVESADQIQLVR